jgi:hypothetical protein
VALVREERKRCIYSIVYLKQVLLQPIIFLFYKNLALEQQQEFIYKTEQRFARGEAPLSRLEQEIHFTLA